MTSAPTNTDLAARNRDDAKKQLWQLILLGWGLVLVGSVVSDRIARVAISASALALNYSAKPAVETLKRNRRHLNDLEDIHTSAFGKNLYDYLISKEAQKEAQIVEVIPAELPKAQIVDPPIRDLAHDIAHFDPHVAIVAESRSGKTTVLIAAIEEALKIGHTVYLFDGKGDLRLEKIQGIHYYKCNLPERVTNYLEVIRGLVAELGTRQDTHTGEPVSVFIDEWNLIRLRATQDSKETAKSWSQSLIEILLQGAAERFYLRVSAHTSRIQDWGEEWNTGILDSLKFVSLGRNGQYDSIEDLIRYQITSPREAKQYQELLDQYRQIEMAEPLTLTTIPKRGFYKVPFYAVRQDFGTAFTPEPTKSLEKAQEASFQDSFRDFAISDTPESAQFEGVGEYEIVLSICESLEDPNLPKSTSAFVKWFWGYTPGGSAKYQSAFKRVNELMEAEGLEWQ